MPLRTILSCRTDVLDGMCAQAFDREVTRLLEWLRRGMARSFGDGFCSYVAALDQHKFAMPLLSILSCRADSERHACGVDTVLSDPPSNSMF